MATKAGSRWNATDGSLGLKRRAGCVFPLLALLCALALSPGFAGSAFAAPGTVYACTVHPLYQHPVTGEIEDSGGSSSRATGQAMVESCISPSGMMEVTEAGECFLTMRMSLVDLTSGHEFLVQDWGGSGWSTPAMGVTGTGTDASGTTNDVCLQLPSANGIVRISMFVESMGRNVIFYAYADDCTEPAPSGFAATIVTEPVAGGSAQDAVAAGDGGGQASAGQVAAGQAEPGQAVPSAPSASAGAGQAPGAGAADAAAGGSRAATDAPAGEGEQADVQSADALVEGAGAASAQGLSLSTAPADDGLSGDDAAAWPLSSQAASPLMAIWLAVVSAGLVLMAAAAAIVYAFRRNWSRWGGADPDDYSSEYRHG